MVRAAAWSLHAAAWNRDGIPGLTRCVRRLRWQSLLSSGGLGVIELDGTQVDEQWDCDQHERDKGHGGTESKPEALEARDIRQDRKDFDVGGRRNAEQH